MRRRDVLELGASAFLAQLLVGCDRLVVLDPRLDPEIEPITPIGTFYTYSYASEPELDVASHETVIAHEATELARFDLAFLEGLPARDKEHTLECIGTTPRIQNIGNAVWTGLPLVEVLDALGVEVPAGAVGLRLVGMDDYHAGVPVALLEDAPIWLVWGMNGEPLPPQHGAPARLLVPGHYGVKNLKWLREIAFVDTPHVSFWSDEGRGWDEEAAYKPNTLIVSPLDGFVLQAGERVRFVGTAFAGEDPVVAVDVRRNGGAWEPATLEYAPGSAIWALWSWDWEAVEGSHRIQVRCTTASGAMSVEDPAGTDRLLGYDGSMEIALDVRS